MTFTNRFATTSACVCGVCMRQQCQCGCAAPAMPAACSCGPNCGCGDACACNRAHELREAGPV